MPAMLAPGFPVLAVAPSGELFDASIDLLKQLRHEYSADLVVISDDPRALSLAHTPIALPMGIPEWISPLASIVPGQLFAYHLAHARGYDTDQPRNIHKVTETR